MLPEYIQMRVAESVLFAGKAIRVLRNPSHAFRFQDDVLHQQVPRGSQKIQGFSGRFPFHKDPFVEKELIGEEMLPQSEADKIETMLLELKVLFFLWGTIVSYSSCWLSALCAMSCLGHSLHLIYCTIITF